MIPHLLNKITGWKSSLQLLFGIQLISFPDTM